MPCVHIDLSSGEVFENFTVYNLPLLKDFYLYDLDKFNNLEYINSYEILNNIYRSYVALSILLYEDNFLILQEVLYPLNLVEYTGNLSF